MLFHKSNDRFANKPKQRTHLHVLKHLVFQMYKCSKRRQHQINNIYCTQLCVIFFYSPQNGFLSALPYVGCALLAVLSGQVADYLRETCLYSTVLVRKGFSLIGKDDYEAAFTLKCATYFVSDREMFILCCFCRYDWASGIPGGCRFYRL